MVGYTISGGTPLGDARPQVVTTNFGHWEVECEFKLVRGSQAARDWRTTMAMLGGPGGIIDVPLFSYLHQSTLGEETYSDGSIHSDGAGIIGPAVGASLSGAHALNATEVKIALEQGTIRNGDYFSLSHTIPVNQTRHTWHLIYDLQYQTGFYYAKIRPWLRAAQRDGTDLEFGEPLCTMAVKDAKQMVLEYSDTRVARPALRFIEV